jgi:hypothetical protein
VPSVNGFLAGQFLQSSAFPPGTVVTGLGSGSITVNNNATASVTGTVVLTVYQAPPVPTAVIQLYVNLAWASLQFARWQEQWLVAMNLFVAHYVTLYARSDASEVVAQLATIIHGEIPDGAVPGTIYTLSSAPPGGVLQTCTVNGVMQSPNGVDYALDGLTITFTYTLPDEAVIYVTWPVQSQVFTPTASTGAAVAAQGLFGGIQTAKSVGDVSVSYQALESLAAFGQWNLTLYGVQLATMAKVVGSGPMCIW